MTLRRATLGRAACAGGLAFGLLACGSEVEHVSLRGAGGSLLAPLYGHWFSAFAKAHAHVDVRYDSTSSADGLRKLARGEIDFAGCDHPLVAEERALLGEDVLDLPILGARVVLAYHLPGIDELHLSRRAYVDLFLGHIVRWNDPRIQESNPGVVLPALDVTVVRRADPAGSTFAFSRHLAAIDSRWRADQGGPGIGEQLEWPRNVQGKETVATRGNVGVAHVIQRNVGAIGYLGFFYARESSLRLARLENRAGAFVAPTIDAARAALCETLGHEAAGHAPVDPPGEASYPLTTLIWLVVPARGSDDAKRAVLLEMLAWCASEGQVMAADLGYVPLPQPVQIEVLSRLGRRGA